MFWWFSLVLVFALYTSCCYSTHVSTALKEMICLLFNIDVIKTCNFLLLKTQKITPNLHIQDDSFIHLNEKSGQTYIPNVVELKTRSISRN